MPAPAPVLAFGALEEQIGGLRWRLRKRDFDSCIYSVDSANEDFVVPGSALPGYPHMRAVDVQPEQVGDVWIFANTEYKGFKNPAELWRIFSRSKNSPSEGFDNMTITLGTREPSHARFAKGATAPTRDDVPAEYPNMFIMDRAEEQTDITDTNDASLYSVISLNLRGLLGTKPYTRRVSCAAQTISPAGNWFVYDTINEAGETIEGFSPEEGAQPVEISLAKLVVTDSFVTTTTPPFGGIPGSITPPEAPDFTDLNFWTTGSYRYHWPFGWRRASITAEKLPGVSVWFWSVAYEFQQKILPD
jgi:hypothetical protein